MSYLLRTIHIRVQDVMVDDHAPRSGQTVTGYGGKIPTRYRLKYAATTGTRWHRVYVMAYGNSGSPYIIVNGTVHHLDTDTEYLLSD